MAEPIAAQETDLGWVDTMSAEGLVMRYLVCLLWVGCGGTSVDCEEGMHRSGDGCAPDRVFNETDSGEDPDTAEQ